jgi:hypothetical protein
MKVQNYFRMLGRTTATILHSERLFLLFSFFKLRSINEDFKTYDWGLKLPKIIFDLKQIYVCFRPREYVYTILLI